MQKFEGVIVSVKGVNSVVVTTDYIFRHKKYKKILTRTTRIAAHNEIENLKTGDRVELVKCRPYSRTKHFRVTKVIPSEVEGSHKTI